MFEVGVSRTEREILTVIWNGKGVDLYCWVNPVQISCGL